MANDFNIEREAKMLLSRPPTIEELRRLGKRSPDIATVMGEDICRGTQGDSPDGYGRVIYPNLDEIDKDPDHDK